MHLLFESKPLLPEDFSDIVVSIVATESMDEDFVESFMRRFQPVDPNSGNFSSNEDSISLLLSPADQLKQRQNTEMNDYTLVER